MRICLNCEADIEHKRTGAIYCSLKCGDEYRCIMIRLEYKSKEPKDKVMYHIKTIIYKTVMSKL